MEILEYVSVENDYLEQFINNNTLNQIGINNLNDSFAIFEQNKDLFITHKNNIKSLYISSNPFLFENTVKVLSYLEDRLKICVDHVVLSSSDIREMIELIEFYRGDIFFAIEANQLNIIEIISFIERNRLSNVNIAISNLTNDIWTSNKYLFNQISPYIGTIYNNHYINLKELDNYNKLILDFYVV